MKSFGGNTIFFSIVENDFGGVFLYLPHSLHDGQGELVTPRAQASKVMQSGLSVYIYICVCTKKNCN